MGQYAFTLCLLFKAVVVVSFVPFVEANDAKTHCIVAMLSVAFAPLMGWLESHKA